MSVYSSRDILQQLVHSRKLLLSPTFQRSLLVAAAPVPLTSHDHFTRPAGLINSLDINVNIIMTISVLLSALIGLFLFNSIIRCGLRCSDLVSFSRNYLSGEGLVNTGIENKPLKTLLIVNYSRDQKFPGVDNECVICLSELASWELIIRVLPRCNHRFHDKCIGMWLSSHSSCPTCRHCLTKTCQQIGGSEALAGSPALPGPPVSRHEPIYRLDRSI